MLWGCFAALERLAVTDENMNSALYLKILEHVQVCVLKLKHTWFMQQDNKNTTKFTSE